MLFLYTKFPLSDILFPVLDYIIHNFSQPSTTLWKDFILQNFTPLWASLKGLKIQIKLWKSENHVR